jgi:hypothetical protein
MKYEDIINYLGMNKENYLGYVKEKIKKEGKGLSEKSEDDLENKKEAQDRLYKDETIRLSNKLKGILLEPEKNRSLIGILKKITYGIENTKGEKEKPFDRLKNILEGTNREGLLKTIIDYNNQIKEIKTPEGFRDIC